MKYKTAFRLALRAIGVLIVAQSFPRLVTTAASMGLQIVEIGTLGASLGYILAYCVEQILAVAIGLYLFFGGKWIVNLAVPSNRPYCHECAYELTGLPSQGVCPECGTPFQRDTAGGSE